MTRPSTGKEVVGNEGGRLWLESAKNGVSLQMEQVPSGSEGRIPCLWSHEAPGPRAQMACIPIPGLPLYHPERAPASFQPFSPHM